MELDQIPSWETHEVAQEGELLAQIEELDLAISRFMDALGRAKSKRASADLWTRIRLKMAQRRELREHLPGPRLVG